MGEGEAGAASSERRPPTAAAGTASAAEAEAAKSRCVGLDDLLTNLFRGLGRCIGRTPGYFILVPAALTCLALTQYSSFKFLSDPEYLFSPSNGESKLEKAVQDEYFPSNFSAFDPGRMSSLGCMGRIIARRKESERSGSNNSTMLTASALGELAKVDQIVQNISVDDSGQTWTYSSLCARLAGNCWRNNILLLAGHGDEIEQGSVVPTYPIWFDPATFSRVEFPFFAGGIEVTEDNTVSSIKVIALNYFLDGRNQERCQKWEKSFLDTLGSSSFDHISVARFTSLTLEEEMDNNTNSIMPYFAMNVLVMIAFCSLSLSAPFACLSSKPWLGVLGVVSAILGTLTAFGICSLLGVPFIGINLAILFLMLGIGIDDTFVMLSAWRRSLDDDEDSTDGRDEDSTSRVERRMSSAYASAAVSITITSVTDFLSFAVGTLAPFPSVRIFCAYSGASVLMTYAFHVAFFGGWMALFGRLEEAGRHALTCHRTKRKEEEESSCWWRAVCTEGSPGQEDEEGSSPPSPASSSPSKGADPKMVFFRDKIGAQLNKPWVKAAVLAIYLVYLAVCVLGFGHLREGLQRKNLARYDSYSAEFFDLEDQYFREFPYRISVILRAENLDYSNSTVQSRVASLISELEGSPFVDPTYTDSWLREFTTYAENLEIDVSSRGKFSEALKAYLSPDYNLFKQDVRFSQDDPNQILASRFLVQGAGISDAVDERVLVVQLRDVCQRYPELQATVFHPYFVYFDQFLMVVPTTLQCVGVAAVAMALVSLCLIPSWRSAAAVSLSVLSTEAGVVGLMALWGVALDSISMVNLVMSVGFSVDFSAHIAYHFYKHRGTSEEKVLSSLYALGLPITQGALSTVIGVIGLALTPSYVFVTFFKMVFLVVALGAAHGLFVLPVVLSLVARGEVEEEERGPEEGGAAAAAAEDNNNKAEKAPPVAQSQVSEAEARGDQSRSSS